MANRIQEAYVMINNYIICKSDRTSFSIKSKSSINKFDNAVFYDYTLFHQERIINVYLFQENIN